MEVITPTKLKNGDEIRVIAPSGSMALLNSLTIEIATKRIKDLGFKVSFGKNVNNVFSNDYQCASIEDRVQDLHEAFADANVKAILTAIGGFSVNQILDYVDYDLIKNNPKIICGFSDVTALLNAIYAKTGLITYCGPHYSSFGMKKGFDYTLKYFKKILMENGCVELPPSGEWSDDLWFLDQDKRNFINNDGIKVINKTNSTGKIIGGNLCTLNLLQGTEYMPELDNTILFIEDDCLIEGDNYFREFDRNIQSLLHCYSYERKKLNGIVVGRAQIGSNMNFNKWEEMFCTREYLKNIPIIVNADFGHTTPVFTFPIGGNARIYNDVISIDE